jgi:hypothetical protein
MDLLGLLSAIWRRKLLAVAMIAVATTAAIATAYKVPSMEPRQLAVGAATSQILVDSDPSTLVAGAGTDQIAALGSRARVYAQYLSSRDAIAQISHDTGIPNDLVTARGPFSQGTGIKNYQQQPAESRAKDLVDESKSYRLVFEAQEDVPIISVYATGPSSAAALNLAKSAFATLKQYVAALNRQAAPAREALAKAAPTTGTEPPNAASPAQVADTAVVVRELGAPEGGIVGGGVDKIMMILAFLAVLGVECFLVAGSIRVAEQRRALANAAQIADVDDMTAALMRRPEHTEHSAAEENNHVSWPRASSLRG